MKVVICNEFVLLDQFVFGEWFLFVVGNDEVLIKVSVIGVNFFDVLLV